MAKNKFFMKGTLPDQTQREMFRPILCDMIDPNHELAQLADKINRKSVYAVFLRDAVFRASVSV